MQRLEPRTLLTADVSLTTSVNYSCDFTISSSNATFSGASLGSVANLGGGNYRYTPNSGVAGVDHFTATFQPTYGSGYGGYNPPPVVRTYDMHITFPFGASNDYDGTDVDPDTGEVFEHTNYFVLQGNTLTISASQGVLKNDTSPQYVSLLSAHQMSDGQYGTFSISSNGAFTYTPNASVFDTPNFTGLTDSCQYFATSSDPTTPPSQPATVFVNLAKPTLIFSGTDIDTQTANPDVWVGQPVPVSVAGIGIRPKVQWTIAGDTFKEYRIDNPQELSEVIEVSASELKSTALTFHWVAEEGSRTVTATGKAGLLQTIFAVSKDIEVHRLHVTINAKTGNTGFARDLDENGNEMGNPFLTMKIDFRAEGDTSVGTFAWLQMIDMSANGIDGYTQGSGLDKKFPAYTGLTAHDAPGVEIPLDNPGSLTCASYDGCFTMNLMWKSPVTGSAYVPLRSIYWFVSMSAYLDQTGWHKNSNSSGSIFNWDQIGNDLTDHPTWNNVVIAP